jgi:hypothetical protein
MMMPNEIAASDPEKRRFFVPVSSSVSCINKIKDIGASDQFMNQHLLGKMRQLGVANLGNSLANTCDWRLDLAHCPCAAE